MKIAIASDLHLEFGDVTLVPTEQADVLVLSGDIFVARDITSPTVINFFKHCKSLFKHVIYVAGNHEFYGGDFDVVVSKLQEFCKEREIHFLERSSVVIDDVTFVGGTLWTDANGEDPLTIHALGGLMNDYRQITFDNAVEGTGRRLNPYDVIDRHYKTLGYIAEVVRSSTKCVVVGHHAPCKASVKPGYEDDYLMNGGYSTDLSNFICDHPQIRLWTHGHTHHAFDYMVGSTRIACNPRGYYGYESGVTETFEPKIVTV